MENVYDARIRNPTPSKLKGKTNAASGNFGVMFVSLPSEARAGGRDAAAKRTSESIAKAATLAAKEGYVPVSRRKVPLLPALRTRSSQSVMNQPLLNTDIKTEQARLLTLLRSLHPILIVNQLCKALAFFGGVPGAPAPRGENGFPRSASGNGSGSLFVGWLAEIFPELNKTSNMGPLSGLSRSTVQRRSRGRPKGSKTKFRRDRAAVDKAMAVASRSMDATHDSQEIHEAAGEWVDVEDSVPVRSPDTRRQAPLDRRPPMVAPRETPTAPLARLDPETGAGCPPTGKRRGRPKGSKNRPRQTLMSPTRPAGVVPGEGGSTDVATGASSRDFEQPMAPSKKKPGRPKGSKNKPKDGTTPSSGRNKGYVVETSRLYGNDGTSPRVSRDQHSWNAMEMGPEMSETCPSDTMEDQAGLGRTVESQRLIERPSGQMTGLGRVEGGDNHKPTVSTESALAIPGQSERPSTGDHRDGMIAPSAKRRKLQTARAPRQQHGESTQNVHHPLGGATHLSERLVDPPQFRHQTMLSDEGEPNPLQMRQSVSPSLLQSNLAQHGRTNNPMNDPLQSSETVQHENWVATSRANQTETRPISTMRVVSGGFPSHSASPSSLGGHIAEAVSQQREQQQYRQQHLRKRTEEVRLGIHSRQGQAVPLHQTTSRRIFPDAHPEDMYRQVTAIAQHLPFSRISSSINAASSGYHDPDPLSRPRQQAVLSSQVQQPESAFTTGAEGVSYRTYSEPSYLDMGPTPVGTRGAVDDVFALGDAEGPSTFNVGLAEPGGLRDHMYRTVDRR